MSALSHVRVLDFTRFLAGPFCTQMLADLGADVVKIEHPKGGDEGRYGYGLPHLFKVVNRNKKGITLDVRTDEGKAIFERLLPHFDVLVENFAGGTLARWGLAPADLCARHPRLIVASLSGFGQTGPYSSHPSYDLITQASSGFMSITGFPDNPPTRGGGSLGDYVQGLFGAIGVMGALVGRDRTGRGQTVDVSSQDAMFSMLDAWPAMYETTGRLPERVGNAHMGTAPYDCYRASDGWVVIAVASNKLFRKLMEVIGRPELGTDDRYRGVTGRIARRDEVNGIVGAWVETHTVDEVVATLGPDGADVPCSPVHTVDQLLTHPQLLARDMIQRFEDPEVGGTVVVPGIVPKLSDDPAEIRAPGPTLGQHNAEVYGELLGLGAEELAGLASRKVI